MINNKRPITAYEFDLIEYIRTKLKEAVEQRIKNQQKTTRTMTTNKTTNKDKVFRKALYDAQWSGLPASLTNATLEGHVRRAFCLEYNLRHMPGFGYRKRIKGPVRAWTTTIYVPNWIIEDREVNLVRLIGREMLKRLNFFRIECSTPKKDAVFTVESESLFVSIDKTSHAAMLRNETAFNIRLFILAENPKNLYFKSGTHPVQEASVI